MHGRDQGDVPGEVSFINTQLSGRYVQYSSKSILVIFDFFFKPLPSRIFFLKFCNPLSDMYVVLISFGLSVKLHCLKSFMSVK